MSDKHGSQVRALHARGYHLVHFCLDLFLDGSSSHFSVYQCHITYIFFL